MPPLRLAPWEIVAAFVDTPEGCGHLIQSILWKGSQCDFLFRIIEVEHQSRVIFARPLEGDDEGNWIVCNSDSTPMHEGWNTGRSYHIGKNFYEETSSADEQPDPVDYIERILRRLENHGPIVLGRLVSVPRGETQECVLLTSRGQGLWLDESLRERSSFRLPRVRDWMGSGGGTSHWLHQKLSESALDASGIPPVRHWMESGRATMEWLHQQLADASSDASFSRRWDELGPEERTEILCGGPEKVSEIHAVMRWALQSQRELWEKAPSWEWHLSDSPDFGTLVYNVGGHSETLETEPPLFGALDRFLVESYIERLAVLVHQRYQCTYDYPEVDAYGPADWTSVRLDEPPTAHEQLESLPLLRQWLQAHATRQEFAEIWQHIKE